MPIRMSGLASNMDTESIVKQLMSAQRMKETKLQNKETTTEWKLEKWKALNTKLYSFYTGSLSKLRLQANYTTKEASSNDEGNATVTANSNAASGTHTLKISQLATSQLVTGDKLDSSVTSTTKLTTLNSADSQFAVGDSIYIVNGKSSTKLDITENTTVDDVVTKLKTIGLNANYDTTQKRFFISSKQSGSANTFSLYSVNSNGDKTNALNELGLNNIDSTSGTPTASGSAKMTMINPVDAKFELDGVALTSSSNVVTVNGLSITLKAVTYGSDTSDTSDDEVVNINVSNSTKATYDMVKSFLKDYNTLLKEMNDDYNADSARGYDPLTDDQKKSMSDDEITKWENKIKDSLLRRDDNLNGIIDNMRTKLNEGVKVNGKTYSLASFGIESVNYTEDGQLHLDGDTDDSLVSGKENKLMEALQSDPDTVANVLSQLVGNLYSSFTESMKSTQLRSALTMYNDKELSNQITDYKKQIKTFESKLTDMENKYYKQFTAMETAMSKMNSQSNSLTSMLGSS